jgi:5'(3')-deoxyribonucleotidase
MAIYVDLDGVLADFDTHYTACAGVPWKIAENLTKEQKDEKWAAVNSAETFFLDLPLMPGALDLWKFIAPLRPKILSAASRRVPNCRAQKITWCMKHLGIDDEDIIIVAHRSEKKNFCQPGDILIDDRMELIEQWNAAGGIGVLFVNAGDAMALVAAVAG